MLDQRRRRWADIAYMSYKCIAFAGQEDFLSNIVHLSNAGLMLGQRCSIGSMSRLSSIL